ncbi:VOC family protein [Leifsonia sp. NPDC058292]|uniref:VOC family protein n=1 Tax=Leifsonia sp. NPDC058292 TaxID=3346428 RepID=UPI0036DE39B9
MLEKFPIYAVLPASDLQRATEWFRDKLELEPEEAVEGVYTVYAASGGAKIQLYETANAGTAENTAMGWSTDDIEGTVAHLRDRGVVFEEYDFPGLKTENGIATSPGDRAAWFKDSEGNILCVSQKN